ncbi:MAG: class I SAM-dependent methyltransferase [Ktedonobacteraceae bacterium]|nr:class I SAM-dependent methyltransferase [Ktedonobacteraceae bacterium]
MTESYPSSDQTSAQPAKKVSIQDRSVLVGDIVVVNGYRVNRELLKSRFAEGGYQMQETDHFLFFTREEAPSTILIHTLAPETASSQIEHAILLELVAHNLLKQSDGQAILHGILDSFHMQEIHIQDRIVTIGAFAVMRRFGVNHRALKRRLLQLGYHIDETPHFLLCRCLNIPPPNAMPATIVVHWFMPEDLHTSISSHLVEEMRPFGCIPNNQRLGELMTGILSTMFPENVHRAWKYFGANTLQRLLLLASTAAPDVPPDYGTLETSATLYQRVLELCVGERFLDAGCNNGLFTLLLAERRPFVNEAIGIDIDQSAFSVAQELAMTRKQMQVRYMQADLLHPDELEKLGAFDTITALHVLEHFTEVDMYSVLRNLLQITTHRLIVAVPYEEKPTVAYDHLQCFSRTKLEAVGQWCLEYWQGAGRMWCEDLAGGLLLVEKLTSSEAHFNSNYA